MLVLIDTYQELPKIKLLYLCEVRITDLPSLTIALIQFHKNLLALGSIPVVGSS